MDDSIQLLPPFDIEKFESLDKLNDEHNFRRWNLDFRNALTAHSSLYIEMLDGTLKTPEAPKLHKATPEVVYGCVIPGQINEDDAEYYDASQFNYHATNKELKQRLAEIDKFNKVLLENFEKNMEKWCLMQASLSCYLHSCILENPRAFIVNIKNPVEAYKKLVRVYGKTHQGGLALWKEFTDIRHNHKASDAASFVGRFQQARQKYEDGIAKIPCQIVYAQFMKAVVGNRRYSAFFCTFTPDEDILTDASIQRMYDDFLLRCA